MDLGLKIKAGDVVERLRKMKIVLDPVDQTVAWTRENRVQDCFEAAAVIQDV